MRGVAPLHGGQHGVEDAIHIGGEHAADLRGGLNIGAPWPGGNAGIGDDEVERRAAQHPGGGGRCVGDVQHGFRGFSPFGADGVGDLRQPRGIRPARCRVVPGAAKPKANARPSPLDAPVMAMFLYDIWAA